MSSAKTERSPQAIIDDVLGRTMRRELWTGNYEHALPISVQNFDLASVLPAVFYMFRFSLRRGKGKFLDTFGTDVHTVKQRRRVTGDGVASASAVKERRVATIDGVASNLASIDSFEGFDGDAERAILGDLLLCFSLENSNRALGRNEQVQRVAPSHYMASWIDLPDSVAHLRYIPEMIVAMLADQKGDYVQQSKDGDKTWFAVGQGFEKNVLLQVFHKGVVREGELGELSSRTSDRFDEPKTVGLDQLLMIRLAQMLGAAPDKLRGKEGERISNQRPIAELAARRFSEDIRNFVRKYAPVIPRHAFVEMLETCMAVGLTTIVTSVIEILFEWSETGEIRKKCDQEPTYFFVDCSNGVNRRLRALAEQSMDEFIRRIERFPVVLMALRVLDHGVRYDRKLKDLEIQKRPYATEWINLLGEILHERRDDARGILEYFDRKVQELADEFEEEYAEAAELLRSADAQPSPIWRLAETLTSLQQHLKLTELIDSVLLMSRPNGLAMKRTVTRKVALGGGKKSQEVRSLIFTDSALEYLVHLLVLRGRSKSGYQPLSFKQFVRKLHEQYGFCIDVAPPGMTISNDLLQENRIVLERRLRDLGLLIGVNDAEAMKHLKPRFEPTEEDSDELD